jgi:predicted MFS family arabinose efflux permease
MNARSEPARDELPTLVVAAALALAAAVSLGLARFSYALLLPPMRADLGWSYLTAGAMNTVNAAGYLVGALLTPGWLRRFGARRALLAGGAASGLLLGAHGVVTADAALYLLRGLTGVASAAMFVSGGVLAARLSARPPRAGRGPRTPPSAGLVLGVYYGGTGVGIVISALLVPPLSALPGAHAWQWAWLALGGTALAATAITALATRGLDPAGAGHAAAAPFEWRRFTWGLIAYFLFGLGYIGYMTFVVTLLREQRLSSSVITVFFGVLGVAVIGSSWVWAGLLQRQRGGGAMRLLNALLALATLLPVLSRAPLAVFASGLLFGGVFLSVVASTTALVRHNLPSAAWAAGISAFTTVFAAGQIIGPTLVGWIADGAGGLRGGLACAAAVLALGAAAASRQKALSASDPR